MNASANGAVLPTPSARLIAQAGTRARLFDAIAAVPPGIKLSIPLLRDALVSQADVLWGIESLIGEELLDRATLRPRLPSAEPPKPHAKARLLAVEVREPQPDLHITGAKLAEEIEAYSKRHGLALHRVSKHLFNGGNAVSRLRTKGAVRPRTIARVRAFVNAAPPPGLEPRPAGGPRVAANGGVTGAELAAELDALIAEHGLSKVAVGVRIYGARHGVEVLRQSMPRLGTVNKVRALLANPPIDELKRRAPGSLAGKAHGVTLDPGDLLGEIRAFLRRSGMAESSFGREAVSDPGFMTRLKTSSGVRLSTVERVRAFIAQWRPAPTAAPPVSGPIPANRAPARSFEEQLGRVERGEVGIAPNIKIGRPDPSGTLGGVTGEINL